MRGVHLILHEVKECLQLYNMVLMDFKPRIPSKICQTDSPDRHKLRKGLFLSRMKREDMQKVMVMSKY